MKHYPQEFKADAVALYQSRPEATIRQVAADLGVNPETPAEPGPGGRREPATGTPCGDARRAAHASGSGERRTAQEGP